jgi:ATP-dependent DNA helicase RecQ
MLELRPFQKEALQALQSPVHLICVAPTGSGKSLIYERLAQRPGARLLLVTPLVALARQQAQRLRALGLRVALGTGGAGETPEAESGAWIVSPEALQLKRGYLKNWRPTHLVVDECHCLWDWGDRFRPSFQLLPELLSEFEIERSVWLTATLPADARLELRRMLPANRVEQGAFDLPRSLELRLLRAPWPVRTSALLAILRQVEGPGLIFVGTRVGAERLGRLLASAGMQVRAYHAGLSREERIAIETEVREGKVRAVICTSAFGMGMDFSGLRWTVLWQAPPSLLALAQAVGRVGRNQGRGRAWVFWEPEDFRLLEWMVAGSERMRRELLRVRDYLAAIGCRRQGLVRAFELESGSEGASSRCGLCDHCAALVV